MPTVQNYAATPGYATALAFNRESTYGQTSSAGSQILLPIKSVTMTPTNMLIKRDPVRRSSAAQRQGLGNFDLKGSIDLRIDPVSAQPLFAMALGNETVAASGGAYAHTFTMVSTALHPSCYLTADYNRGSIYQYMGCKVNSMDLTAKLGDDLTGKFGLIGQTFAIIGSSSLSGTFTNIDPFDVSNSLQSVTINGQNLEATDLAVSLKTNMKQMFTGPGGRFTRAINETGSDVTGTFTVPFNSDVINQLLAGASGGPAQNIQAPINTIVANFVHPQLAGGSVPFSMTLTLNNAVIESAPVPVSFGAEVMQQVKFSCAESVPGAADALKIVLVNSNAAVI